MDASNKVRWKRRTLLQSLGIASAAYGLESIFVPETVEAAVPEGPHYFLMCFFSGGWDQLLAFDPRDNTAPEFAREDLAYTKTGTGIFPAYHQLGDPAAMAVLSRIPSGIQTAAGSPLTFGPAVPASLIEHAQDFSLLRGIDMGTLAHEVGRRYLITGKFPRGLAANGSGLTNLIAAASSQTTPIPHLSVGTETFNEGLPASATALRVSNAVDLQRVLTTAGTPLSVGNLQALSDYEATDSSEAQSPLNRSGLLTQFRQSQLDARELVASQTASLFQFTGDPTKQTPQVRELLAHFGVASTADVLSAKGQAALAAQALTSKVAPVISIELANGLDTHLATWRTVQPQRLNAGFDALGKLIAYLKKTRDSDGQSFFSRTTLFVFSEFSRTPLINPGGGRDHHLASSALIAGPGIRPNRVIGATSNSRMAHAQINLQTGAPDSSGVSMRPQDIHATLLHSMGLSYAHLANQNPRLIPALLR